MSIFDPHLAPAVMHHANVLPAFSHLVAPAARVQIQLMLFKFCTSSEPFSRSGVPQLHTSDKHVSNQSSKPLSEVAFIVLSSIFIIAG